MRTRRVTSAIVLLCATTALGLPAPAEAATAQVRDRVDHRIPAASDLTRLRVRNGAHRLDIALTLRSLDPARTTAFAEVSPVQELDSNSYEVGIVGRGGGHVVALRNLTQHRAPACHGLRARLDTRRDVLHLSVPRRCLTGLSGSVAVSARTQDQGDLADADTTRTVIAARS